MSQSTDSTQGKTPRQRPNQRASTQPNQAGAGQESALTDSHLPHTTNNWGP